MSGTPLRTFSNSMLMAAGLVCSTPGHAAEFFSDDQARRAILQLREQNKEYDALLAQQKAAIQEQTSSIQILRKSLLDLSAQIEQLRADTARQREPIDKLARDMAELQRQQKDLNHAIDDRVRRLEPVKVNLDGRDFLADPAEKRQYDQALATLSAGDFGLASTQILTFVKRYPSSGYFLSAHYWLGNALYGKRDYKEAISAFRVTVSDGTHQKASEALLAIANCQLEMKDVKATRATWAELGKLFPDSEAAKVAAERLASSNKQTNTPAPASNALR